MTLREKTVPPVVAPIGQAQGRRAAWIVATLFVVAVIAAALAWAAFAMGDDSTAERGPETQQEITERLVNEGYLPRDLLSPSAEHSPAASVLDDLVNRGLIPREAASDPS